MKLTGLLIIFLLISQSSKGQDSLNLDVYKWHSEQSRIYFNTSNYAKSIQELEKALIICKNQDWEVEQLETSVFLAEVYRKVGDLELGLDVLQNLEFSIDYPQLHMNKLGRMAALFSQGARPTLNFLKRKDTIDYCINIALKIAIENDLKESQASLYNEKGFALSEINQDSSFFYLKKAADLFKIVGDTQNYIGSRINEIRLLLVSHDTIRIKIILDELHHLIRDKEWYDNQVELYDVTSGYYEFFHDSSKVHYWRRMQTQSALDRASETHSEQMNAHRILYETEKFQNQVIKKEIQLNQESRIKSILLYSLGIILVLLLGIVILWFKERKLKKAVDKANSKYHMLIVESNHRIKNNLQMIISMLEFSSKGIEKSNSEAFKRMSSKIQTISALHKHLYLDIHNEKVNLDVYFNEIISLYDNLSNGNYKIIKDFDRIAIQSERIVYFGLIFNEMLSNTFEHSNSKDKTIYISVLDLGDRFQFTYQDNSSFKPNVALGTGTNLIEQLVKRIEGVEFNLVKETGKYQFVFNA